MFFLCIFGLLVLNLRTQESIAGLEQDIAQMRKPVTTTSAQPTPVVTPAAIQEEYTYIVENQWDASQKLVRINDRTGQKEDVFSLKPSVFSLSEPTFSVNIRSRIDNSLLVLQLGYEIDAPLPKDNFWLYNIETKQVKKMNSEIGPYGVFSPDGRYYVYPVLDKNYYTESLNSRESRELVALDIVNDTQKSILNLPSTETLIERVEEFRLAPNFTFGFIDKNTIEYFVYKPSKALDGSREYITKRFSHL